MKLIYEGSVKNIYLDSHDSETLIFDFTDDYSVFDWGKMPDTLLGKGESLATLSAFLFKRLRDPKEWQRFFETRADLIGSANPAQRAVAQLLSQRGLKNHFKSQISKSQITVDRVHVSPPVSRMLANGSEFFEYRMGELNRSGELIPLEVVFRHELTSQSSALGRYPESGFKAGQTFDAPFLECFSKLEPADRYLTFSEAPVVGRLSALRFEEMLVHTHWVAQILKVWFAEKNIRLIDGKLEWALSRQGELMLVDAIGPDELRLEYQGQMMSKERLRGFYRETPWYDEIVLAKRESVKQGKSDWKKFVSSVPPKIPSSILEPISKMYIQLTQMMTEGTSL